MKLSITTQRKRRLIGITPLIDIVFILLFFFMLASNLETWQVIDLRLGGTASTQTPADDSVHVAVRPGPEILWRGQWLGIDAWVSALHGADPQTTLVLIPEQGTPVQDLVSAIEACRHTGFSRVTFGVGE